MRYQSQHRQGGEDALDERLARAAEPRKAVGCMDLKTPRDAAIEELLRTSDIFIHNIQPGAIERAQLDYEAMK